MINKKNKSKTSQSIKKKICTFGEVIVAQVQYETTPTISTYHFAHDRCFFGSSSPSVNQTEYKDMI